MAQNDSLELIACDRDSVTFKIKKTVKKITVKLAIYCYENQEGKKVNWNNEPRLTQLKTNFTIKHPESKLLISEFGDLPRTNILDLPDFLTGDINVIFSHGSMG